MKLRQKNKQLTARGQSAFTLTEAVVSAGLAGIMFISLLGGFSSGFALIRGNRENSRATQILLEKMEMLRLYNWDQITGTDTNTFVPTNFTARFYPESGNNGFLCTGTVAMATAPIAETYASDLKSVKISLTWTSGNMAHARSMTTYVSKYGLQNYIY